MNFGDDLCPECEYYDGPDVVGSDINTKQPFYCNAYCGWLYYYNKKQECCIREKIDDE
jgi:hypothetical protein